MTYCNYLHHIYPSKRTRCTHGAVTTLLTSKQRCIDVNTKSRTYYIILDLVFERIKFVPVCHIYNDKDSRTKSKQKIKVKRKPRVSAKSVLYVSVWDKSIKISPLYIIYMLILFLRIFFFLKLAWYPFKELLELTFSSQFLNKQLIIHFQMKDLQFFLLDGQF